MSLEPGRNLAHYETIELIGKGGMGEVYRARDKKLGREVAIKILPEALAADGERLARFQREATVLASLNHPNIGAIYGLEEAEGFSFLVLELVPGETLAERLRSGPIPVGEALELAAQIAEALAAAHDRDVIHRDLKPANVKVTPEGQVKVLDFGLAKALSEEPASGELSDSPTLSAHATRVGVILGTAAYMSPEQARGKPVDKRTDVFSFGVVLYEMLTGRQLFRGEDAADTMASVIRSDPDLTALPANLHPRVRELLARCLEKDPRKRRRDIGDIGTELASPSLASAVSSATGTPKPRPFRAWVAALLFGLACGVVGWQLNTPPEIPRPVQRFEIPLPGGVFSTAGSNNLALSPDGAHLAFAAGNQLYLRALDQIDATLLPGTEGSRQPVFSPDGEWVAFWANGEVKKAALAGGTVLTLGRTPIPLVGLSWEDDDTIVFADTRGVWELSANSGEPRRLIDGESGIVYAPQKLPGNEWLLLTVEGTEDRWGSSAIAAVHLESGERKILIPSGSYGRYLPSGHLLYTVGATLFAVTFDLTEVELAGSPVPVVEGVQSLGVALASAAAIAASQFAVARDGTLAYVPGDAGASERLLWIDRNGQSTPVSARVGDFATPRVSPDGRRLAVVVVAEAGIETWILDIERDTLTQLTDGGALYPDWSPDGEWVVFTSAAGYDLFRIRSDFSGVPEHLLRDDGRHGHASFTPDGKSLVYQEEFGYAADVWMIPLPEGDVADEETEAEPRLLVQTEVNEAQPDVSPDGRFLAYHSTVSGGRTQIFVQPFPDGGARRQVSTDGGVNPLWSPKGDEIFYLDRERQAIMAVSVRTAPELVIGTPQMLFEWPIGLGLSRDWDVAPDGQRFVVLGTSESASGSSPRIHIVLNWFEELKQLAPRN